MAEDRPLFSPSSPSPCRGSDGYTRDVSNSSHKTLSSSSPSSLSSPSLSSPSSRQRSRVVVVYPMLMVCIIILFGLAFGMSRYGGDDVTASAVAPHHRLRSSSSSLLSSARLSSMEFSWNASSSSSSEAGAEGSASADGSGGNTPLTADDDALLLPIVSPSSDRITLSLPTNQSAREAVLADLLRCHAKGRVAATGLNYFYDAFHARTNNSSSVEAVGGGAGVGVGVGVCRPFPRQLTDRSQANALRFPYAFGYIDNAVAAAAAEGGVVGGQQQQRSSPLPLHLHRPPPDVTMVHVLEGLDRMPHLPTTTGSRNTSSSRNKQYSSSAGQQSLHTQQQQHTASTASMASPSSASVGEGTPVGGGVEPAAVGGGTIVRRQYPSAHSRWLFNEWRLWEGELGCPRDEGEGDGDGPAATAAPNSINSGPPSSSSNLLRAPLRSFVTYGAHRKHTMNELYQLDHFCMNEEDGTLVGFELGGNGDNDTDSDAVEGGGQMHVDMPDGKTEFPGAASYEPNSVTFAAHNQLPIPLVRPPPPAAASPTMVTTTTGGTAADGDTAAATFTFEQVATASLNAYYKAKGALPDEYPSVLFAEGTALFHPMQSHDDQNPGHMFHRYASSHGIRSLLNVSSLIFTSETIADNADVAACSILCRTQIFPPLVDVGDDDDADADAGDGGGGSEEPLLLEGCSKYNGPKTETKAATSPATEPAAESEGAAIPLPPQRRGGGMLIDGASAPSSPLHRQQQSVVAASSFSSIPQRTLPTAVAVALSLPAVLRVESDVQLIREAYGEEGGGGGGGGSPQQQQQRYYHQCRLRVPSVGDAISHIILRGARGQGANHNTNGGVNNGAVLTVKDAAAAMATGGRHANGSSNNKNKYKYNLWRSLLAKGGDGAVPRELIAKSLPVFGPHHIPIGAARGMWLPIPKAILAEVCEDLLHRQTGYVHYGALLASGAAGCERHRCDEGGGGEGAEGPSYLCTAEGRAAHRRCAVPFVAIATSSQQSVESKPPLSVTPQMVATIAAESRRAGQSGNATYIMDAAKRLHMANIKGSPTPRHLTHPYVPSTRNYSRAVWNGAVRAMYREAKRLRRDVLREAAGTHSYSSDDGDGGGGGDGTRSGGRSSNSSLRRDGGSEGGGGMPMAQLIQSIADGSSTTRSSDGGDDPQELRDVFLSPLLLRRRGSRRRGGDAPRDHHSVSSDADAHPYLYILAWRRRLVHIVGRKVGLRGAEGRANSSGTTAAGDVGSDWSPHQRIREEDVQGYLAELLEALVEALHLHERALGRERAARVAAMKRTGQVPPTSPGSVSSPLSRRPPLICYRKAYVTQVRNLKVMGWPQLYHYRGMLNIYAPGNCHTRELLANTYASYFQRYASCPKPDSQGPPPLPSSSPRPHKDREQASAPTKDPNHNAHPLFVLPPAERRALQRRFAASRRAVEQVLSSGAEALRRVIAKLNITKSTRMQQTRDDGGGHARGGGDGGLPPSAAVIDMSDPASAFYTDDGSPWLPLDEDGDARADADGGNTNNSSSSSSSSTPSPPLRALVQSLVRRVEAAQRAYDDVLMAYFERPTAARPNRRPIRLFQVHRSVSRGLANARSLISRLASGPGDSSMFGRLLDVEFSESSLQDAFPVSSPNYNAWSVAEAAARRNRSSPHPSSLPPLARSPTLDTPRSSQVNGFLTADLIIGPHGADLHVIAMAKPSAFAVEFAMCGLDSGDGSRLRFNGGFFTPFAFGRNIGYLKVFVHRVKASPDRVAEKGIRHGNSRNTDHSVVISLPDYRQIYSVTVCSWLATNAVRLGDERRAAAAADVSSAADADAAEDYYGYIIPWWCRGGASAVVRGLLRAVIDGGGEQGEGPPQPTADGAPARTAFAPSSSNPSSSSPTHDATSSHYDDGDHHRRLSASTQAVLRPSYYTVRSVPSQGYGFVEPFCPVLYSEVGVAGSTSASTSPHWGAVTLRPKAVRYEDLIQLQSVCAKGITLGSQGSVVTTPQLGKFWVSAEDRAVPVRRFRIEGLQTLIESALLCTAHHAQLAARLVVEGTRLELGAVLRDAGLGPSEVRRITTIPHPSTLVMKGYNATLKVSERYTADGRWDPMAVPLWCGVDRLEVPPEAFDAYDGREWKHKEERRCVVELLTALLHPEREGAAGGNSSGGDSALPPPAPAFLRRVPPQLVAAFNVLFPIHPPPGEAAMVVHSGALRGQIVEWITEQFFRVNARPPIDCVVVPIQGTEFSYGANCSRWMPGSNISVGGQ